jgi:tRNA/rRNA methyltransferase
MTNVSVVLVRPLYAINVGSVSRAMTNMGVNRLVLIDPQCEIGTEARKGAANGQQPLADRIVYKTWSEFFANEGAGLKIGLSARDGRLRQTGKLAAILKKIKTTTEFSEQWQQHTYFIFGPEDCGLSEEDLDFVHFAASLPIYGANRSLNLAHAVLLTLYIMRSEWANIADALPTSEHLDSDKQINFIEATGPRSEYDRSMVKAHFFPEQTIRLWLETLGFSLDDRRISAYTTLKRLLLHNVPSETELGILESILQQNIRKLNDNGYPR